MTNGSARTIARISAGGLKRTSCPLATEVGKANASKSRRLVSGMSPYSTTSWRRLHRGARFLLQDGLSWPGRGVTWRLDRCSVGFVSIAVALRGCLIEVKGWRRTGAHGVRELEGRADAKR